MKVTYSFYNKHKWLLILAGKWHLKLKNPILNALYRFYAEFLYYFSMIMIQNILFSIFVYRNCSLRVMELSCYYVQYVNVMIMSYLSRTKKMKKVLTYISEKESQGFSVTDLALYEKYSKINERTLFIILSLTLSAAVPWYTISTKASLVESQDPNCPVSRWLNYQMWYPFDLHKNHLWVTKLCDTLLFHAMFFSLTFARVITAFYMVYVLGNVKLLEKRIGNIDETAKDLVEKKNISYDEAVFLIIKECAKKYEEVQSLMHLVNVACREFNLIGFFCNSMEVAVFLMQLLLVKTVLEALKQSVIVIMTLTQLFLFLWYANGIKEESGNLANVIYNRTNWINYNTKCRKMLLILMTRSQKPLTCNSIFIGDMTIDTFKAMIKLCYSITTFFKTAYL